jgi:hypothetical protein
MKVDQPPTIYKDDPDPINHQIAKLVLTTVGSWLAAKLIEVAYNSHFDLKKPTKG